MTQPMIGEGTRPASLSDFVGRRFAARSPLLSWAVFERLGGAVAFGLARLGTSPATVTLVGGLLGVLGALRLATADGPGDQVLAGALLLAGYVMDCADGQLARGTGTPSARGGWLDVVVDAGVLAFVSAALSVALIRSVGSPEIAMLLAGSYGAARTAALFTSTLVRGEDGGMRVAGAAAYLRRAYVAVIDTPVVYLAFCVVRGVPSALAATVAVVSALSAGQAVVSARHHFSLERPRR